LAEGRDDLPGTGAHLLQDRQEDPIGLLNQGQQEMFDVHRLMLHLLRLLLGTLDDLLCLERELIEPHGCLLASPKIFIVTLCVDKYKT
jgi:hypothetical protein